MLSPLTTAVLAVTPPTRAGLASSIVTTSRQIGSVLGIALLGTLVSSQFTANIASSLTTRGVPDSVSQKIATAVANAGSQANKLHFPATFPIPMQAVHTLLIQAFTNAIHRAFLVSGIALLCTSILSALLLGRGQNAALVQYDAEGT